MIETTIPEINVSELMERVRARIGEMRRTQARPKFPPIGPVEPMAATILPKAVSSKTEQIGRALQVAREAATVSRWIPKPFRGLFRRQDKVNNQILRTLESLSNTNAQLAGRLRHLTACVEVQDHGIHRLAELRRADNEWMNAAAQILGTFADKLVDVRAEFHEWRSELNVTTESAIARIAKGLADRIAECEKQSGLIAQKSESLRGELAALEEKTNAAAQRLATIGSHGEELAIKTNNLEAGQNAISETLRVWRKDFENVGNHVRALQAASERLGADLQRDVTSGAEHYRHGSDRPLDQNAQYAVFRRDLESLEQRYTSDAAFIKAELSHQSAAVYKLVDQINTSRPAKAKIPANNELADAPIHRLDAFYFAFENRFRGPREEIKRRLRFYLPILDEAGAGIRRRSILDLGTGRGEWLELLRDQNRKASGVDLNEVMVEQCKERGLDVVAGDALEFLRQLPDNSQGAVTGFHIIEHLPLDTLVSMFAETYRVLRPGGIAIFESPNCKNLAVGATYFYMDPTHRNPVFPETAQFMLESNGFERVRLEYLSPVDTIDGVAVDEQPAYLRELLYGPRDFGVIGYKATSQ